MMSFKYSVIKELDNKTFEDFINYYHVSKQKKSKLLNVKINDKCLSLNSTIHYNDIISIDYEEVVDFKPLEKKIDIIYEDDYLLIVNKPKGIIIHPDDKESTGTLVNLVANYYKLNNINLNVRFVHRIDTDTTGLIIFAKDIITASYMNYLISIHEIKRSYLALVSGKLSKNEGVINYKIGRDRHHNQRRIVSKTGDDAQTYYKVLSYKDNISSILLTLKTGRTHQIRVHLSHMGYPLLGDTLYGGNKRLIDRQALHSYILEFTHPFSNKKITLEAPIPKDMAKLL